MQESRASPKSRQRASSRQLLEVSLQETEFAIPPTSIPMQISAKMQVRNKSKILKLETFLRTEQLWHGMVKSYICHVLNIPLLTRLWDLWIFKPSKWSSHVSEPETGCKDQEAVLPWRVLDASWAEKPGNPVGAHMPICFGKTNCAVRWKWKYSEVSEHVTQREMSLVTLSFVETAHNSNKVRGE